MPKDPERFGSLDSVSEDLDDMLVQAGDNIAQLKTMMLFFQRMFEIAKPFTNPKTYKISAPGGTLPISELDPSIVVTINSIDGAFIESMRQSEWITVFSDGYKRCKQKLEQVGSGGDFGEKMK